MDKRDDVCDVTKVEFREGAGEAIIHIIGDFDSSTTHLFHNCCDKIQKSRDIKKVILDFEKAGKVDTSAFACVVNFIKEHGSSGSEIFLKNLHDPDKNLIQLLKVQDLIKIIKSDQK